MTRIPVVFASLCALTASLSPMAVRADDTVKHDPVRLRVADSLPTGHIISETLTKPWIERVRALSKGAVAIQYYPAEQIGKAKDFLPLTQSGMIDIGYIGPSYVSEKMPLSAVAELPGSFGSACQAMSAYWDLAKEGGYLYEHEFRPNRIRPLLIVALPPYQVVFSHPGPIATVADLAGRKVRASGGAQDLTLRKLGMAPVRMAPPEIYESMARGTIDGALLPYISVESYKLGDLVKVGTVRQNFGAVILTYSIGEAKWKQLGKEVQDVLRQAGDETVHTACKRFDDQEDAAAERLGQAGMTFVHFDDADQKMLAEINDQVARDWAKSLDERGRPGTETLLAYRKAVSDHPR